MNHANFCRFLFDHAAFRAGMGGSCLITYSQYVDKKAILIWRGEMDTLVVRDFDTAIDAYIASWTTGFRWESVNFSQETYLNIKLEGVQWDGSLD